MPAKKSKIRNKSAAKKSTSKMPDSAKIDKGFSKPVKETNRDSEFFSGLMKFLVVLAVLDFLAILGVLFIIIAIKIFT